MKIISFNINSIRAHFHQIKQLCVSLDPDILAVQEIKVATSMFPYELAQALNLHAYVHGQATHYGVALLAKSAALSIQTGLPNEPPDAQCRLITGEFPTPNGERLVVINCYVPQGEDREHPTKFAHKQRFYAELTNYLATTFSPEQNLIVLGDMNVAPLDLDVGIGAKNAKLWLRNGKCGFLPEERAWFCNLNAWGLTDLFRQHHPQVADQFSWFDYRSRGFEAQPQRGLRIDHLLATTSLATRCNAVEIDYAIRAMERPSDHCPIWADLDV